MQTRADITNYILVIEQKFPVDKWEINNIHIWPIIRINLYFFLINKFEKKEQPQKVSQKQIENTPEPISLFSKETIIQLKNYIKYKLWISRLKKKKYFFFSHHTNSSVYQEKNIIRFLDPIIWQYQLQNDSNFCIYGNEKASISFNSELKANFNKALYEYECQRIFFQKYTPKLKSTKVNTPQYKEFLEFISTTILNGENIENYIGNIKSINESISFYLPLVKNIFKKTNPAVFIIVGYYDCFLNYLFLACANIKSINTIEIQHGPQTDIQVPYGSWKKKPELGFNTMPKYFWCWDNFSKQTFQNWIKGNPNLDSFVGGNPWIEYFNKNDNTEKKIEEKSILYTLQPAPLTLDDLFPINLIKTILERKNQWILRLHPLQQREKENLIKFLRNKNLLDIVRIDDSNSEPLPISIKNCFVHVTNFSGSAIEAELLQKYSVILHPIGEKTYQDSINKGSATYINPNNPNFISSFYSFLKKIENREITVENKIEKSKVKKYLCLT